MTENANTAHKRLTFESLKVKPESCEDFVLCPASLIERLRGDLEFQRNKADSVVTLNSALEAERDRLRAALEKAADTFADFNRGLKLLNRPLLAEACEVAEKASREALS